MFFQGQDFDPEKAIRRARAGDRKAWDALVARYQALVYSVPRRMGLTEEDCADVFQHVFLTLYRNLDRIQEPAALPKWLATAASREALRLRRIAGRTESSDSLEDIVAEEDQRADTLAEEANLAQLIREGLTELGGRCQSLLTWLYIEDLSYQEVETLGVPIGAIGPTRARCLEKLRKIMEKKGVSNQTEGAS